MLVCEICKRNEEQIKIFKKSSICVSCKSKLNYQKVKEVKLQKCRDYYKNNKEKHNLLTKRYYHENRDSILERQKEYNFENKDLRKEYIEIYNSENKEKISLKNKKWLENNKEKKKISNRKWIKNKLKTDDFFRLKISISSIIRNILFRNGFKKSSRTHEILGCSFEEFKLYLESNFEPWMTWENRGLYNGELNYGWDIDHRVPISSAKTEEEIIKLNHFTNLQPLCGYTNRHIKRDTI